MRVACTVDAEVKSHCLDLNAVAELPADINKDGERVTAFPLLYKTEATMS